MEATMDIRAILCRLCRRTTDHYAGDYLKWLGRWVHIWACSRCGNEVAREVGKHS